MRTDLPRKLAPIALSLLLCLTVWFTLEDYGFTWDENFYFQAGCSYAQWLLHPSLATMDQTWGINAEHPPLPKVLGGLTWVLFHETTGLLGNVAAFRLANLLWVFLLNWALYAWAAELYGHRIAFAVTLACFFLPRLFFDAHLAALDYPLTALGFLVLYTYWKGIHFPRWTWLSAFLLGLALLTKVNAVFLYGPLLLYGLYASREQIFWSALRKPPPDRRQQLRVYARIFPFFLIPPLMLVALWPWLWQDTLTRLLDYFYFHRYHYAIPVYYLGTTYAEAPWHYPFVLTGITVPVVVLALIPFGLVGLVRPKQRETNLFILLNALLPLLLSALPGVPRYDGVRLFLLAFPFLTLIAGLGLRQLLPVMRRGRMVLYGLYLLLLFLTIYLAVVRTHPYPSSYYNEWIGGVDGAVQRGFEAEYWGNAYRGLLPWLNDHPESTYWLQLADREPKLREAFDLYRQDGWLRAPVHFSGYSDSDYVILLVRQGMFDEKAWHFYTREQPVFAVYLSRTMLAGIYRLR